MKCLLLLAALAAFFVPANAHAQSPPLIYVENQSTLIPQAEVDAALPAFQVSISRDLAAWWGTDAWLTTNEAAKDNADMRVYLVDDPTVFGAYGFHEVNHGQPVAWIFARTNIDHHEDWRLTMSHELDEMIVDPWINRYATFNGKMWLVEVADPPESGLYSYFINGVPMSDFVLPNWYDAKSRGPYDFTRKFKRPGQIGRHGYASWKNPDGSWGQVFGSRPPRR